MEDFDHLFEISRLISGYLKNDLSVDEQLALDEWLSASPDNRERFVRLTAAGKLKDDYESFGQVNHQAAWGNIVRRSGYAAPRQRSFNRARIGYAAVLFLTLCAGAYFLVHKTPIDQTAFVKTNLIKNDIPPGTNKAILTLANGQKLVLDDAKDGPLTSQGNTAISKTASGRIVYNASQADTHSATVAYNTISTPAAGKWEIILPDHSHVWLDAKSSIRFPTAFHGNQRRVEITGQAYFEVAYNKAQPFVVNSRGQVVEVLGTHFNINAYAEEPAIKTTLLEGSVKVNGKMVLKPGEQSVNAGNVISVSPVDTENTTGWKNDDFVFNNQTFGEAMREIARWYDVEIIYDHVDTNHLLPGGWISRKNNISAVLKVIAATEGVHFKIEGRRITIEQ